MDTLSTLLTHEQYFGLDAWTLRDGVKRLLTSPAARGDGRIGVGDVASAFRLDETGARRLVEQWLAHRLVRADGADRYRISRRLRPYAMARIVEPLERARARRLLREVRDLARTINAQWRRNALVIGTVAVSGSYMSRRQKLGKLYIWLVVQPRPVASPGRRGSVTGISDGAREILDAVEQLSSYMVPRVVADRRRIERPFSVIFEAADEPAPAPATRWWWLPALRGRTRPSAP